MTALGAGTSDPSDAESYTYDANGNRLTLTKRDLTTTIGFGYDPLNRMASKSFAAPNTAANVAYDYDPAGRPMNALFNNVSGTPGVAWTYDAAGRRISEATNGRTLAFTYDANGNPATLTWPDGLAVTYAFDAANRFSSVGNSPATVTAGYDSLSRLNALTRTSGSSSAVGYDPADRMTSLAHAFTPSTGNQTWGYSYTPASQLTTTTSTNSVFDWNPAAAGAVNTVADGLDRNATVAGVGQAYDAFGNLTSDGTRHFIYDTENRLLTESGPVTLALSYDPMGRLQQSVINGATTQFLYDGDALVGEYPASGNTPLRRYVHGPGVDNPLIWYEGGTMTTANASYLITDRQGSIAGTANTSGSVTATYEYDAYGAPNAWGTVGSTTRFRYTGQAVIPEAQLYYYKARVYDPVFGRFLQTDPVGYGPDVNWYAYVGNDPVNHADPTGMIVPPNIGSDPGAAQEALADVVDFVANVAEVVGYGTPEGPAGAGPIDEGVNALRGAADLAREGAAEVRAAESAGGTAVSTTKGAGKAFTPTQRRGVLAENRARNGGQLRSDKSGRPLVPAKQSQRGVSHSPDEAHVDHIQPRS